MHDSFSYSDITRADIETKIMSTEQMISDDITQKTGFYPCANERFLGNLA